MGLRFHATKHFLVSLRELLTHHHVDEEIDGRVEGFQGVDDVAETPEDVPVLSRHGVAFQVVGQDALYGPR